MLAQQLDTLLTRDHFDLHMARIDQRFGQLDQRFERTDQRMDGIDTRLVRLERVQAAQTVLLSITTLAVVIPLIQSSMAS